MDSQTEELIKNGSIEVCPNCQGLSAYAWGDVDETKGIAHIGACSCWEWTCGHCRTSWMERNSPLNCEAYTHNSDEDDENDELE